ncbi:hypothetical protein [uncultured Hydrogenophaga sp.]|uniref:hypothetical protein n=1 Tax=uncultured Hydrogenophaga sp. TaxID=199683 RepID=UPI00265EB0BA|nr:hypothetical protein [uncultured Hydrogenophaga sp.]
MIWGQHNRTEEHEPLRAPCAARNPLLLFEPRPASPWTFQVRELEPRWQRHIERLQRADADHRTLN